MERLRLAPSFRVSCFLLGILIGSSSLTPPPPPRSVISLVGNRVVLPCSWKELLPDVAPAASHVLWATPAKTVFELWGDRTWQAEEFQGRAGVPRAALPSGDCSLVIRDVQIADAGRYEGFMLVNGGRARKTRIFIQSVRLAVLDRKSIESRSPGEDFVLDLYTNHSMRVVFQPRNSSVWSDLWMRGDEDSQRLEKHLLKEELKLKRLKRADEGLYRVVDEHGLAVNTVNLYVEGSGEALKFQQMFEAPLLKASSGATPGRSGSLLLLWAVLLTSFLNLLSSE